MSLSSPNGDTETFKSCFVNNLPSELLAHIFMLGMEGEDEDEEEGEDEDGEEGSRKRKQCVASLFHVLTELTCGQETSQVRRRD